MVTPVSQYIQSGHTFALRFCCVEPRRKQWFTFLHTGRWVSTVRETTQGIKSFFDNYFPPNNRDSDVESPSAASSLSASTWSEKWTVEGCHQSIGRILHHPAPETQRYAFRALVWLLQHSNDKRLINQVLEYVNSYPEVVLDSGASSQTLYEATLAVARHIRRLEQDPIEWHGLNTTQFRAKCGSFIYLNARPWLHSVNSSHQKSAQYVYDSCYQ
ncbi:hypothetical protein RSAG8_04640, partial [Rhizoctonia solani AG-8 WAC10335]